MILQVFKKPMPAWQQIITLLQAFSSWIPNSWPDAIRTRWAAIVNKQNGATTWLGSDFQDNFDCFSPLATFFFSFRGQGVGNKVDIAQLRVHLTHSSLESFQIFHRFFSNSWIELSTKNWGVFLGGETSPDVGVHKIHPVFPQVFAFFARPQRFGSTTGRFRCTEGGHRPHCGTAALVRGGAAQRPRGHVAGGGGAMMKHRWRGALKLCL